MNGVINHYYKSDKEVQEDSELQGYIKDIFEQGFLSKTETGEPFENQTTVQNMTWM